MPEIPPLAADFQALAQARASRREERERRLRVSHSIPWLARVLLGVPSVWISMLTALWFLCRPTPAGLAVLQLGALLVHVVLACAAVLPHTRPIGTDRRVSTVALGASLGLVVVYAIPAGVLLAFFALACVLGKALQAAYVLVPLAAPLSIVLCCAQDVARDVSALRGRSFSFRDCAWILLGLLSAYVASMAVLGPLLFLP